MELVVREGVRQDRRGWRDVLAEYRINAGARVPVTLPRVEFLERAEERDERDERAAAA